MKSRNLMRAGCFAWLLVAVVGANAVAADRTDQLLAAISGVSDKGQGHKEAIAAAKELSKTPPAQLVRLLKAMNDAGPLARNWLRGAFETAAATALKSPSTYPKADLVAFFQDHKNAPAVRRLAFEWIVKVDPEFGTKTIPESLADPSSEMRRDAVAFHIARAKELAGKGDKDGAKAAYELALTAAGDEDQLKTLSQTLKKDYDQEVDLVKQSGLVLDWYVIGPFDNKKMKGFNVAYPPESEVDFAKEYPAEFEGMTKTVKWQKLVGENPEGKFDIAKLTAPHKGAISYIAHEFVSDKEQPVEFRFATPNAWKLWLNGKPLFGREEYHRGMFYDMYQVRAELKKGRNVVLLKMCQNEQKDDWAQVWAVQFRVCDTAGRALHLKDSTTATTSEGSVR